MRVVWSWLQELFESKHGLSVEEAASALTRVGFEVEALEKNPGYAGVVVAEVVDKKPHPQAEKLTLVEVKTADHPKTLVVCGAQNVPAPGGRVLWARPGAQLPGGITIAPKELKGVMSAGMLCSEKELGISDESAGIAVLTAEDAGWFGKDDAILEVNVPANRPDGLGHLGVARELAAAVGGTLKPPKVVLPKTQARGDIAVKIEDAALCPRYIARVITGLTVGPSPLWLRMRLQRAGVRSISNLVNVTNYVMFELGHPLHAFDLEKIKGGRISVRRAKDGEKMTTLDNVARVLTKDDIVIADDKGPVALAGVMGGLDSEVSKTTKAIVLEAATFDARSVRKTSRRLGLLSEASYRFERRVDDASVLYASDRAAELLCRLGGESAAVGAPVDDYPRPSKVIDVKLRASRAQALSGIDISRDRAAPLLARLDIAVNKDKDPDVVIAKIPTFRPDLTREVDLIEEVLRQIGFAEVPATLPQKTFPRLKQPDPRPGLVRDALTAAGLNEAITFGFVAEDLTARLGLADKDPRKNQLKLKNPMTLDQAVMRTSLLPSLLQAVAHNLKHGVTDIRLFEVGSIFLPQPGEPLPKEPVRVAGVLAGLSPRWLEAGLSVDFFDAKAAVTRALEAVLGEVAKKTRFVATRDIPYLHSGVSAKLEHRDHGFLGEVGEVHPRVRQAFDIDVPCFVFDLDLERLPMPHERQMAPIPRFPAIARDISFFVAAEVPAERVEAFFASQNQPLLVNVTCLEDYRDPEKVPAGQKGMLWSLLYRAPERTLTDAEVNKIHEALVQKLVGELGATRR